MERVRGTNFDIADRKYIQELVVFVKRQRIIRGGFCCENGSWKRKIKKIIDTARS